MMSCLQSHLLHPALHGDTLGGGHSTDLNQSLSNVHDSQGNRDPLSLTSVPQPSVSAVSVPRETPAATSPRRPALDRREDRLAAGWPDSEGMVG